MSASPRFAARFATACLLAVLGLGSVDVAAQTTAKWTVVVYLDADNDLEAPMMKDLQEMLRAGGNADINVVLLADRNPEGSGKYSNDSVANLPNWTTTKLLAVQPNKLQELADWGELNMGDPDTLHRLLTEAVRLYPAEKYALIFGDHGMAWPGIAVDESSAGDTLTTLEIASVLGDFVRLHGKLEMLGFDACVMANLEVAAAMSPFAKYMVASEELEPVEGWDYTAWLTSLQQSPSADGAALGHMIIDSYHDSFANNDQAKGATLSLLDMGKIPVVERAVEELAGATRALLTRGGRAAWINLARARSDTEEYGRSTSARGGSLVYDLRQFADNVVQGAQDPASARAAAAVAAAVRGAVTYEKHGEGRPQASGLSIFFPQDKAKLTARDETSYDETGFAQKNRWFPFLQDFASNEARDTEAPVVEALSSKSQSGAGGSRTISAHVDANDIDSASLILAIPQNGKRIIIGAMPVKLGANGQLTDEWDGEWFAISDGDAEFICPITDFEEVDEAGEVYWAAVPAQLRMHGTREWLDVTLNFLLNLSGDDAVGDLVYAVEDSAHGQREIDLMAGDELRPVYVMIDSAGEETLAAAEDGHKVLHLDRIDDIKVEATKLPAGSYQIGFRVEDLAGNHNDAMLDIEIP